MNSPFIDALDGERAMVEVPIDQVCFKFKVLQFELARSRAAESIGCIGILPTSDS